jgi:hypothetical protein
VLAPMSDSSLDMRGPLLQPTSYLTLGPGTPTVDRFGRPVGEVSRVLLHDDGGFDGLVIRTQNGARFVDAPEVRRISADSVTLGIALLDVLTPDGGQRVAGAPVARHDRVSATEADRDEAIAALKDAFVNDELSVDELGDRVALVHVAETLDELDAAVPDP